MSVGGLRLRIDVFSMVPYFCFPTGKSFEKTEKAAHRNDVPPFLLFAQHERTLTGANPQTALIVGRLQPKARVSIVRWNLKEAGGKRLAR